MAALTTPKPILLPDDPRLVLVCIKDHWVRFFLKFRWRHLARVRYRWCYVSGCQRYFGKGLHSFSADCTLWQRKTSRVGCGEVAAKTHAWLRLILSLCSFGWQYRRYSDFQALSKELKALKCRVPSLPPKNPFGVQDNAFLTARMNDLGSWMTQVQPFLHFDRTLRHHSMCRVLLPFHVL